MMVNIEISSRCLLAIVFACSAVAKLRGGGSFRGFREWLEDLPVPVASRHASVVAAAMAVAEVLIVVLIVLPWTVLAGFMLAGATLAVFIAGTCVAIARGTKATCNCFGTRGAPLGRRHVARDTVLLAVAMVGAVASDAHGAHPAGVAVSVATAAFLAVLVVFLDDVLSLFAVGSQNLAGARQREG
jgi:methylamine utilization protein MauE